MTAALTAPRRLLAAVAAALALCALAAWVTYRTAVEDPVAHDGFTDGRAVVGRTYTGFADDPSPRVVIVRVPDGWLHIAVTRRFDHVESDESAALDPPPDGSFVGIETGLDPSHRAVPTVAGGGSSSARVSLVAGGRHYPIANVAHPTVAVRGTPAALAVVVDFDGVTQTVDVGTGRVTPGRAAALYATQPSGSRTCGTASFAAPYVESPAAYPVMCRAYWRRVPWLQNLGWAPPGHAWLLIAVTTSGPVELDRGGSTYDVSPFDAPIALTCGGTAAAAAVAPGTKRLPQLAAPVNHDRDTTAYAACPVGAGSTAPVDLGLTERLSAYAQPDGNTVSHPSVRWTVRVG